MDRSRQHCPKEDGQEETRECARFEIVQDLDDSWIVLHIGKGVLEKPEPEEMSAGPDEVQVSKPPTGPKPPKRGTRKGGRRPVLRSPGTAPQRSPQPKPDLQEVMGSAGDVDIEELLADDG